MNLRDKKGSISIFVLVALLFMASVLLLMFASSVNKSKIVKEQFNTISGIYAYSGGDEGAYDKSYTDLRKKNARTFSFENEADSSKTIFENTAEVELTKTFDADISNYRIYGNSIQNTANGRPAPDNPIEIQNVGDRIENLFDYENSNIQGGSDTYLNIDKNDGKYIFSVKQISHSGAAYGYKYDYNITSDMIGTIMSISAKFERTGKSNIQILCDAYNGSTYLKRVSSIGTASNRYETFTIPENTTKIQIRPVVVFNDQTAITDTGSISNIMLNVGDKALEYIPYKSVKYKIPVRISGKNIFEVGKLSDYFNNINNFTISDDTIFGKNVAGSAAYITNKTYYSYSEGDSYTFSFDADIGENRAFVALYDEYKNNISSTISINELKYNQYFGGGALYKEGNSITINNLNHNIKYLRFGLATYDYNLDKDIPITVTNVQLEKSNSRTEYQPYKEQIVNLYIDEPLRKVGDVADYIDFKNGKVVRNVRSLNFNVSDMDNWENYPGWNNVEAIKKDYPNKNVLLSNITSVLSNITNKIGINTENQNETIFLYELTQTQYKENYPNLKVNILYGLSTSDEPQSVELPKLKTYEDYTKIEVLTEVKPSKIEVEYQGYTLD